METKTLSIKETTTSARLAVRSSEVPRSSVANTSRREPVDGFAARTGADSQGAPPGSSADGDGPADSFR